MSEANLLLRIKANADQAVREIGTVEGATQRLGTAAKAAGLLAAAGLTTMAVRGVAAFADFDTGMREVFTLTPGMSQDAMGQMTDDVKAFAQEYALTTEEVIPALYQAISAGVPADNVMTFMATAAQTARGGVTDMQTAVDGLTSAVNAYGAEVLDAQDAADIMFTGVRLGKTTIGELSDALFQVAPIAAASGVGFDQVVAALAAMTAQGVPTRVAATNLRGALVELGKEGTIAAGNFEQIAGQTFPEFIAAGGDLNDAFMLMGEYATASGTTIQNQFGAVEAGMAATVLGVGVGAQIFGDDMDQMAERAGAAGEAFGTMAEGAGFTMDQMRASAEQLMLSIGESLMPVVQELIPVMQQLLPPIADLIEPLAGALLPVVEAIVPLLEEAGPLFQAFGDIIGNAAPLIKLAADVLAPVVDLLARAAAAIGWVVDALGGFKLSVEEANAINEEQAKFIDMVRFSIEAGATGIEGYARILEDRFGYSAANATAIIEALYEAHEQETAAAEAAAEAAARLGEGWQIAASDAALLARATDDLIGPEKELGGALAYTALQATAVWEAEQTLANSRRAALDPVFAALQAEQDLIDTTAEVVALQNANKTGTDEYRLALLAQLQAQADLDAAHGRLKASSGQTLAAIVSLGEKLGWTSEQTQALTGWVTEFNTTTPDEFDAQAAVENLADQMGIAYEDALDLALALGTIDGTTYTFLLRGSYEGPTVPGGPSDIWDFKEIPRAASGGQVMAGGLALVGEAGAEIVDLPAGSTIYPHGPGSTQVYLTVEGSVWSVDELATEIETSLARAAARGADSALFGGR